MFTWWHQWSLCKSADSCTRTWRDCPFKDFFVFFSELFEELPTVSLQMSLGKYVIFTIQVQQMIARLLCGVIGHLMVIDSQQELDAVAPNETTRYWIDLNDLEAAGNWVTSLTGRNGFTKWQAREPTNKQDECCVVVKSKRMLDSFSTSSHKFVCEKWTYKKTFTLQLEAKVFNPLDIFH